MKPAINSQSEPVIEWDSKVLMYTNPLIMKQLFGALGAMFLITFLIVMFISGFSFELLGIFIALFAFFILLAFVAMAVMGGYYLVHNTLGEKSFVCETQRSQTRLMKLLCAVGFLGGMSQGNYTIAGSSVLAASRLKEEMKWKDVTSVTYNPKRHYIYVKTGLFAPLAIFCNPDNYDAVEAFVREHTQTYLDKLEAAKKEADEKKKK